MVYLETIWGKEWSDRPLQSKKMIKHMWFEPGKYWIIEKKTVYVRSACDEIWYGHKKAYISWCKSWQFYTAMILGKSLEMTM